MASYNLGMETDCCGEGWILVACYRNPRNGFHPVFPSACLGSWFHGLSQFGHRRFGKIVYQGHPRVWSIVCPESFVPFPQQNFWNILKLQLLLNEGRPRNIGNYFYTSDRIYLVSLVSVKPKNKGPWIASSALPLSPPRFLITLVMPSGADRQFHRNLNWQSKPAVRDEINPASLPGISPTRPYGARESWVWSRVSRTKWIVRDESFVSQFCVRLVFTVQKRPRSQGKSRIQENLLETAQEQRSRHAHATVTCEAQAIEIRHVNVISQD